ncbi:ATP-binding protein [Cochleicola gelatinilyticus]|nr:tetratricopeptide repeat-containing sensor histidine kinase [Cochleicola gelatinilyticus]
MSRLFFILTCSFFFIQCDTEEEEREIQFSSENYKIAEVSKLLNTSPRNYPTSSTKMLDSAYQITNEILEDSVRLEKLSDISYAYYKIGDSAKFRQGNRRARRLAQTLKDTNKLARLHWDLGNFFYGSVYKDSAFYHYSKSERLYRKTNNMFYAGRMQINKAIILTAIGDYTGSEIATFSALKTLQPLKKYNQIYRCYNNLGIVNNELEQYEKALYYHEKALEVQDKISKDNFFETNSINNIGVVKRNQKKFKEAQFYFKEALNIDSLYVKNPKLYAMVLDNYYYSTFKNGEEKGVLEGLQKALKIRDSINDFFGISINQLHLAEYLVRKEDTLQALDKTMSAYDVAKQSENFRDVLSSLLLLSKLKRDQTSEFLTEYITLKDSLQKAERRERNKFTRIAYETEQFKQENATLENQKALLISLIISFVVVAFLIVTTIMNRLRNRSLLFKQKEQKANEEIYTLLLSQQSKMEQGRLQEKERISEELHDGILNKLFGLRLSLDSLNNRDDIEAVKQRKQIIDEMMVLEKEIREISHELSVGENLLDVGFDLLITELVKETSKISELPYELVIDEEIQWNEINNYIKINVYRIIQESFQNIIKHAEATSFQLYLTLKGSNLEVIVSDTGKGFDIEKKRNGIGVKNMTGRIKKMDGTISFSSRKGEGTVITCMIPIQKEKN